MTTDMIEQLKAGPTSEPSLADRRRTNLAKARDARQARVRPKSEDFADEPVTLPHEPLPRSQPVDLEELQMKVKLLWDDYEERQRKAAKPTTMKYRCIGYKPDGTLCGEIVEAGIHEERIKTGEIVRCPHGPDAPAEGIKFDRERYPIYHYELTPMEPIW